MEQRTWMYVQNCTCADYLKGVNTFIDVAVADKKLNNKIAMHCPCVDCKNEKKFYHSMHIHAHLIMRAFKENYRIWYRHGEEGINPGEPLVGFVFRTGDQIRPSGSNNNDESLPDDEILNIDDDYVDLVDNMDQLMKDAEVNNQDQVNAWRYKKFQDLVRDSKKALYDGSTLTLLDAVLKLLKLKAS